MKTSQSEDRANRRHPNALAGIWGRRFVESTGPLVGSSGLPKVLYALIAGGERQRSTAGADRVRKATLASILRKSRPGVGLNEHLEHPEGDVVFRNVASWAPRASSRRDLVLVTDQGGRPTGSSQEPGGSGN
jgi:hypothetical protein